MSTIDHFYYDTLDAIGNPFYDWERHLINLGCDSSDFDLVNGGPLSEKGLQQSANLVHEYIHYLQNFVTAWGVPVFTDYALALMKIGASSKVSDEQIDVPINTDLITNQLLLDGLNMNRAIFERLNRCDSCQVYPDKPVLPLTIQIEEGKCVVLTNGRVVVGLGIKLIREHMAALGTQLYLKKNDSEIHSYNLGLFAEKGVLYKKPEYWILFEYIYELNKFENIARGIFHLAQYNLITLNPEQALQRFLIWFEASKTGFTKSMEFYDVVQSWIKIIEEDLYLQVGVEQARKHCQRIIEMTGRNSGGHDLMRFTLSIASYALSNLSNNKGGYLLFDIKDDFTDFDFWRQKIATYGTGLVKYLDDTFIHGSQDHVINMQESFYGLLSASIVLKKILKNRKAPCPFLDEIPICKAQYRGSENCIANPFLMIMNDGTGAQCLFANGVLLLGMEKRLFFES